MPVNLRSSITQLLPIILHVTQVIEFVLVTIFPATSPQVNWAPGSSIAIASSSYDAREVDTAVISAVTHLPDGTSRLQLDRQLAYTHLGVLRSYAGDPGRHVLAMQAEVAVLDRNIVIQVM
jgi:hypothetical protein